MIEKFCHRHSHRLCAGLNNAPEKERIINHQLVFRFSGNKLKPVVRNLNLALRKLHKADDNTKNIYFLSKIVSTHMSYSRFARNQSCSKITNSSLLNIKWLQSIPSCTTHLSISFALKSYKQKIKNCWVLTYLNILPSSFPNGASAFWTAL